MDSTQVLPAKECQPKWHKDVAAFLDWATQLYQSVLHASDPAQLHQCMQHDHDTCHNHAADDKPARRFTDEIEQYIFSDDNQLTAQCKKLQEDILLRLLRPPNDSTEPLSSSYGIQWTEADSEAFGARILDLCNRFKAVNPDKDVMSILESNIETVHSLKQSSERRSRAKTDQNSTHQDDAPFSSSASAGLLADFVLDSISFKSMNNREAEVADAHGDTFDWIFKYESSVNSKSGLGDQFTKWLRSDELGNTYWVTGKPGAGKSTLMRYIAEHHSTDQLLQIWAGKRKLVKAVFYFWTSGSEEQKSQSGLLRSLLHQLLSYNQSLIPIAFPKLWQKLSQMTTRERIRFSVEWNIPGLMEALNLSITHLLTSTNICFFIDGLDEFDGDHQTIIDFFRNLSGKHTDGQLKLCLSSRPWSVFEKAFQYSVPNLKLEELTLNDMTQYVQDNLAKHPRFKDAMIKHQEATAALVSSIVKKAEGVFLWVRLVIKKVLELYGQIPDLTSAIDYSTRLPSDLNELFDQLLYRDKTSQEVEESTLIFELVQAREMVARSIGDESSYSLSIWEFVFAIEELGNHKDDNFFLSKVQRLQKFREVPDQEIMKLCEGTLLRILSGSCGLLEVYQRRYQGNLFNMAGAPGSNPQGQKGRKLASRRVTYLHRTVRDYLLGETSDPTLATKLAPDFDPHLRLVNSYVLRLRNSLEPLEKHRRLDELYPDIALALTHARATKGSSRLENTFLIEQLEEGVNEYWNRRGEDDHWARSCFGSYEQRKGNNIRFPEPFLALCTKFGLEDYVSKQLDHIAERFSCGEYKDEEETSTAPLEEETPLLTYALEFLTSRQKTIMPLSSFDCVFSLLESNHRNHPRLGKVIGTPNMVYNSPLNRKTEITPWLGVLSHLRDAKRRGWIEPFDIDLQNGTKRWVRIVELLIENGADLNAFLKWNGFDEECHARDVLVGPNYLGGIDDYFVRGIERRVAEHTSTGN